MTRASHVVTFTPLATVSLKTITFTAGTVSSIAADSLNFFALTLVNEHQNILKNESSKFAQSIQHKFIK